MPSKSQKSYLVARNVQKKMLQRCRQCRINSPTLVGLLQSSTLLAKPWIKLSKNLFEFQKKNYLLVVDYHNRYIKVRRLDSLFSAFTVDKVESIFSTHRISKVFISDNEVQFSSRKFQEFARVMVLTCDQLSSKSQWES